MTETEIRDAIVTRLSAMRSGRDAAYIAEMHIGGFSRRADLVVANGHLAAFEIKTERDTLVRLEGQLATYRRYFEQVTVVCAERHLDRVMAMTEETLGVWVVRAGGRLEAVRSARTLGLADHADWLSFLPVDALRGLLRSHDIDASGPRHELISRAVEVPRRPMRAYVLDHLKQRNARIDVLRERQRSRRETIARLRALHREPTQEPSTGNDETPLVGIPRRLPSKIV